MLKKRVLLVALAIFLALGQILPSFSMHASAVTDHSVYYSDFDKALSGRCIEFQNNLKETGSKQYGLLFSLRILCSYQLYVEFMGVYYKSGKDREGLGIASRQVSTYEVDLHERLEAFNTKYGSKGTGYEKLKLVNNFTGKITGSPDPETKMDVGSHKQCRADIRKNLIKRVPKYLKKLLSDVQSEVATAKGDKDKENQIKAENTTLLTNIYQVYLACVNSESDLNAYTPFDKNDKQVKFSFGDGKGNKMKAALDKAVAPYNDLMEVAKDALDSETEEEVDVDLTASYVDNLSNAQTNSEGVEIPEVAKLDPLYYAIMAASSVYVPFQSYAGSTEFQSALKSLTNDDQVQLDMVEFYSATKDLRKPLYKREFDDAGYPTGTAKLMTIDDFINDIKEGRSGALCTVLGEFKYDGGTGSWIYLQGNDRNTVEFNYDDVEENSDVEVDESEDSGEAEDGSGDDGTGEGEGTGETTDTGFRQPLNGLTGALASVFNMQAITAQAKPIDTVGQKNLFGKGEKYYYDTEKKAVCNASGKEITSSKLTDEQKDYIKKNVKDKDSAMSLKDIKEKIKDAAESGSSSSSSSSGDDDEEEESSSSGESSSSEEEEDDEESSSNAEEEEDNGVEEVANEDSENGTEEEDSQLEDQAVFAYEEITDETKLSEPLYMYGTDYSRAIDNTTSMVITNALKSSSNLNYISDKTTRYVYVNPYGDIVTDDNLILFPGIANPLLYSSDAKYNPYTAAFMNCYPKPFKKSSYFKLTNKQDIGKYLIVKQSSNKSSDLGDYAVLTDAIDSIKITSPLTMLNFTTEFKLPGGDTNRPLKYSRLIFTDGSDRKGDDKSSKTSDSDGSSESKTIDKKPKSTKKPKGSKGSKTKKTAAKSSITDTIKSSIVDATTTESSSSDNFQYTPLCDSDSIQANGITVFPYVVAEDSGYGVAQVIASNIYNYLMTDQNVGDGQARRSKFNENYILHNFIISGINGTNNPKGYTSSTLNQYNRFVNGASERFLTKLKGLSSTIMDTTSDVRGVIGLRECMQNPVLGRILMLCRTNVPFFILVVAIILLFAFSKMKLDLFQMIVKLFLSIIIAYLAITVVPTYLPMFFNIIINNVSETMSYKILATKTENESIGNLESNALKEDGTNDFTSGSITLYRSGVLNYQSFVDSVNVSEDEIIGGNIEIIDQEAGLFAEGDSIKMNTSTLFDTLKIEDTPTDADGTTLHYLKAYKTVNNNMDYYTPYYQIVDSFLDKMNTLELVSEVPRNVIVYSNGVTKDNFLVYSYVNSMPFLTPGHYGVTIPETINDDDTTIAALQEEAAQYAQDLYEAFGDENTATDFLGIADWLYMPSDAMRQTLWYKTMQDQGYYDEYGTVNQKKMDDLITYVNYHTKKFIYSMGSQIGKLSDDTMTKIICMRALTAFTVRVSQYGDWLYPFSLNYGEMTLGDVIRSVFISDYAQYTNNDMDVVEYIGNNKGWLHLIVFDFMIIILFVVTHVVQMLVYLMYVLLMIAVILKVVTQGNTWIPVKGFLKCTALIMGGYTAIAVAFAVVNKTDASAICIYVMLLVVALVTYVLAMIVTALVGDLANLGDSVISVKMANSPVGGLRQAFQNVNVSNLFSQRSRENFDRGYSNDRDDYYDDYSAYGYDADIDEIYDGPVYNEGYEMDDYRDQYGQGFEEPEFGDESFEVNGFDYDKTYDDLTVLYQGDDAVTDEVEDLR